MENAFFMVYVIYNANYFREHIPTGFGVSVFENENSEMLIFVKLALDPYSIARFRFFATDL